MAGNLTECVESKISACLRNVNTQRMAEIDPELEREFLERMDYKQFEILIPSFILVVAMMFIGIPGNVITVCVYKRKMRRTASRVFILALAFVDLANCLFTMPIEVSIIVKFVTFDYPIICSVCRTSTYILNGVSALLLCGIAVDRFRKICRPLKPVFTPKKTRSICIVATLIGIAFYIPGFIIYGTRTVLLPYSGGNITYTVEGHTCQIKDEYKDSKIKSIILAVWFLGTLVLLVALIVMYARIGCAVNKRLKLEKARHQSVSIATRSERKKKVVQEVSETSCSFDDPDESSDRKKREKPEVLKSMSLPLRKKIGRSLIENIRMSAPPLYAVNKDKIPGRIRAGRTTMMLFSVTIAYVMSFIPFIIVVVIRTMRPHQYHELTDVQKSLWNFFLRSYVFNCAVNPILYGFFNKDFRKKMMEWLKELVCC
ncbi:hypothetical protein ACF0H5_022536 [Mactra antiquata]